MCVIWLGSVKGRGKSHRKVRRSVDMKYVVNCGDFAFSMSWEIVSGLVCRRGGLMWVLEGG